MCRIQHGKPYILGTGYRYRVHGITPPSTKTIQTQYAQPQHTACMRRNMSLVPHRRKAKTTGVRKHFAVRKKVWAQYASTSSLCTLQHTPQSVTFHIHVKNKFATAMRGQQHTTSITYTAQIGNTNGRSFVDHHLGRRHHQLRHAHKSRHHLRHLISSPHPQSVINHAAT